MTGLANVARGAGCSAQPASPANTAAQYARQYRRGPIRSNHLSMARIGFIQTRGIGDIVIALPIAAAFSEAGHSVFWPVDAAWVPFLRPAAPYVEFLEVPSKAELRDYYVGIPRALLKQAR